MKAKIAVPVTVFILLFTGLLIYEKEQKNKEDFIISTDSSEIGFEGGGDSGKIDYADNGDGTGNTAVGNNEAADGTVFAYICGEVYSPGVYGVGTGGRVVDVLELAGGFTQNAASDFINLAETVRDGMKIYVPSLEETEGMSPGLSDFEGGVTGESDAAKKIININSADKELLKTLPGIGETKAEAIINYRNKSGGFKAPEDIMNVKGIGESTYGNIKDLITVN